MLITDVVMPLMGGPALSSAVRARWPFVPVIYMTGYPDGAQLVLQEGSLELMAKPFVVSELLARVRKLLEGPAA